MIYFFHSFLLMNVPVYTLSFHLNLWAFSHLSNILLESHFYYMNKYANTYSVMYLSFLIFWTFRWLPLFQYYKLYCTNSFVHKAFSSPLLIIPLDRFREMTPSGQKVTAFWRLMWHTEMSQQCSYPSAEWDTAKLPQPFHHLIIFPLKSLSVMIRSTRNCCFIQMFRITC